MNKSKSQPKEIIYEDNLWKVVFVKGGMYILLPKWKCQIYRWELKGGAYAITVPIVGQKYE